MVYDVPEPVSQAEVAGDEPAEPVEVVQDAPAVEPPRPTVRLSPIQEIMAIEDQKFLDEVNRRGSLAYTGEAVPGGITRADVLAARDLPAQQARQAQERQERIKAALQQPQPIVDDSPVVGGVNQYDLTWLSQQLDTNPNALLAAASAALPKGFRMMIPGEEIKCGDMIYKPLGEDLDTLWWQPTTPDLYGIDTSTVEFILARRTVRPQALIANVKQKLDMIEQVHTKLGQMIQDLKQLLQGDN